MPRRRRKKSSGTKAPLEFEESPVHIIKNVPSPVFCSDNPVTAEVIPVDECSRITWVSPQFEDDPTPYLRKSRRRRLCSGNTTTQSRRKSLAYQQLPAQAKSIRKLRKGVVPLQFIGDVGRTELNCSSYENLSINENDLVESEIVVPTRLNVIYSQEDVHLNEEHKVEEYNVNQFDEPQNDIAVPEIVSGPCTPRVRFDTPPVCPLYAIVTPDQGAESSKKTPLKKVANGSCHKKDPYSFNLTQKRPTSHTERKQKKLIFASDSDEKYYDCEDEENMPSLGFTVSDMPLEVNTKCEKNKQPNSPLRPRLRNHRKIFSHIPEFTPDRQKKKGIINILAYDTPEEDYGLTGRQRILKKYKRHKKKI